MSIAGGEFICELFEGELICELIEGDNSERIPDRFSESKDCSGDFVVDDVDFFSDFFFDIPRYRWNLVIHSPG